MPAEFDDPKAFASRLRQALRRSPKRIDTPGELATQFNLRYPAEPVTPQAAQKWMAGTAKPRPDKVHTLAKWLNVNEGWLRFGVSDGHRPRGEARKAALEAPSAEDLELLDKIRQLPAYRRRIVEDVVSEFTLDRELGTE